MWKQTHDNKRTKNRRKIDQSRPLNTKIQTIDTAHVHYFRRLWTLPGPWVSSRITRVHSSRTFFQSNVCNWFLSGIWLLSLMVEGTVIARGPQGYNWLHFVLRFEVVSIFFFTSIMTYYVFVKIGAFTIFRQLKTKAWYTALRLIWLQVEVWSFTLVALLAFHVFL